MNKKFLLVSVVTLLLGTTTVMADNHRDNHGPQKPQKEMVQKNKPQAPKPQAAKPAPKPVVHKAPAKHKPTAHAPRPHRPEPKPACPPSGRCHKPSPCHCHGSHHCHSHCRPLPPRPVKQVRVTPPFSPIQVTVRI